MEIEMGIFELEKSININLQKTREQLDRMDSILKKIGLTIKEMELTIKEMESIKEDIDTIIKKIYGYE